MRNIGFNALLHVEDHGSHGALLAEWLGDFGSFLDQVVLHGILDTLKPAVFLFLTYLLMEFIEHKAADKAARVMHKAGAFGPILGGALGAVPQCGFSAAAANLYTGRVISAGTLIAVFVSTSDEMLPILLATDVEITTVLSIIVYKILAGILAGALVDLGLRLLGQKRAEINIDEICEGDECHCERGVLYSACHHTVTVSLFILAVTLAINTLVFFLGEDVLVRYAFDIPFLSHLAAALVGLFPGCAASVALTKLGIAGFITSGAMISGLCSGAGVGLLVLFRMNRRAKENLLILALLLFFGVVFGMIADLIPFMRVI